MTNHEEFAAELTDLCLKHGIGIEGATAYLMEGDDHLFSYTLDDEGRVVRQ